MPLRNQMRAIGFVVALMLLLLTSSQAAAALTLFSYQGQPLDMPGGSTCPPEICSGVTAISGVFLIDLPFDTGGNTVDVTSSVLSYTFTDGITVISDVTPGYDELFVFNVSDGIVLGWGVDLSFPQPFLTGDHTVMHAQAGSVTHGHFPITRDFTEYCIADDGEICTVPSSLQSIDNPGELVPCSPFPGGGSTGGCFPGPGPFPAPEPTTLALLGIALAGLGFSRRKRIV